MNGPQWAAGMRKLGPGIYHNDRGEIHVSEQEFCAHFGKPVTPENERIIIETMREAIKKLYGIEIPHKIVP